MVASLAGRWWVFLVQGVVMIVLAFLAFSQPATLVKFIGAYAVIDGILKIFSGLGDQPDDQSRWPALIIGVLSVLAGLYIWLNPLIAGLTITFIIAVWAIVVGVLLLVWAFRLRQEISDEWVLIIFAALSIIFGILAFANLQEGYLTLQWYLRHLHVRGRHPRHHPFVPHQEHRRATGAGAVARALTPTDTQRVPGPSSRERS